MQDLTTNPHYRAALATARTLRDAGHQAFYAGGCVRDLLLGLTPKDFDVATSATPEQVLALFPKTFAVGAHFGVVLVLWGGVCQPSTEPAADPNAPKDVPIEVATFRHDGAYSDGRRPDAVRFSSTPDDDVRRRDFTINGMLLDPIAFDLYRNLHAEGTSRPNQNSVISTEGAAGAEKPASAPASLQSALAPALIDLVHGQRDLAAHTIRAIGDPDLRFAEDKLRMLRAVRFAARLNFTIEPRTARAIQQHAAQITVVSPERIRDELSRILTEGGARRGFELLDTLNLLPHILPEVARLKGVAQPPEYHPEGDVWTHTLLLLQNLPQAPQIPEPHQHPTDAADQATASTPGEGRHSGPQVQNLSISPTPTTDLSFRPEAHSAAAAKPASTPATELSFRPERSAAAKPASTPATELSFRPERSAVEKPASPPPITELSFRPERSEAEKPASPLTPPTTAQPFQPQKISPNLPWGALLHDIGKPATYTPPNPSIPNDRIRFNNHVDVGIAIAERILARLRFSTADTAQILALIKNHMRFGDILHMKHSTLRRFLRLPRFPEHLALHWLDVTAAHNDLRLYDFALQQYLSEPPANLRPAPLLTGRDLIAAGYPPSPQFKPMLTLAEDAQLDGTITTPAQALALIHHHFPLPT